VNLRKVQIGQKLSIPAAAFNSFVDAALDYRRRTAHIGQKAEPSFRPASMVLVRNDSGSNQNRLAVLGIDSPIIDPATNENEFKNRVAFSCVMPAASTHEGRFVVLAEPIAAGKTGRAYAAGVCPVFIVVPEHAVAYKRAEIYDSFTNGLVVRPHGSASILWRQAGWGGKWAIVRLGNSSRAVLPVDLTQVGGSQGDQENPATWTYDVLDVASGETLASAVDPTADPHKWQRTTPLSLPLQKGLRSWHHVQTHLNGHDDAGSA